MESEFGAEQEKDHESSLPFNDIFKYKEAFDKEALQKKKKYLTALREHNAELIAQIKALDKKINKEIESLGKKIVSPIIKRSFVPKFDQIQTLQLKHAFEQMQRLKREVEIKRTGTSSLQFLQSIKLSYINEQVQLDKQIALNKIVVDKRTKIKDRETSIDKQHKKESVKVGEFDMFAEDIQKLKRQVKEKSQSLRIQKESFFASLHKDSNKDPMILHDKQPKKQSNDPDLIQLKNKYHSLGKKLELLKIKKIALLHQKDNAEQLKLLEKVKQRYDSLIKIVK